MSVSPIFVDIKVVEVLLRGGGGAAALEGLLMHFTLLK